MNATKSRTIRKLVKNELRRMVTVTAEADAEAEVPFGACPYGADPAHDYQAAWESQREGVSDGVVYCRKCGDMRRIVPFVPLDDR